MVATHPAHVEAPAGTCALMLGCQLTLDARPTATYAPPAQVLIRMLNTCIKEPHQHLAVLVMQRGGRAHLDFIQNMEYKFIELLSTSFLASDEETVVRRDSRSRYNRWSTRSSHVGPPPPRRSGRTSASGTTRSSRASR